MTAPLTNLAAAAPAIAMVAAFACAIGGLHLIVRRRDRTKGALMLAVSVVLVGNVLIWTV